METSVDKADGQVSYSRTKQLVDIVLSRFYTNDVESKRPRGQWCLIVITVYLTLLTGVTIFLLHKVLVLEPALSVPRTVIYNTTQETETLKEHLGVLQSQVNSLCGEEGQLDRLRANLSLVRNSTYMLGDKLAFIRQANVRLVGETTRGRVELKYNGSWGTVCDDNFDTMDGTVICRMLGYSSATSVFTATAGTGKIFLDEVACSGNEWSIFDCTHSGIGVHNCGHGEDAGVQCA